MSVFPEAVGDAMTRFFPSRSPALTAASCGGYSSLNPSSARKAENSLGRPRSSKFMRPARF